jgi:hypothetical protein
MAAKLAAVQKQAVVTDPVTIEVRGKGIEVKAVGDWAVDAMEDVADGKFKSWAQACLTDAGLKVWQELRPTFNEVQQMFSDFNAVTGQHPGK